MTAICPAGPPKLSAAIRIQVKNASRSDTPCLGSLAPALATPPSFTLGSRLVAGPIVGLAGGVAAPTIECIVEAHGRLELRKIVPIHP